MVAIMPATKLAWLPPSEESRLWVRAPVCRRTRLICRRRQATSGGLWDPIPLRSVDGGSDSGIGVRGRGFSSAEVRTMGPSQVDW